MVLIGDDRNPARMFVTHRPGRIARDSCSATENLAACRHPRAIASDAHNYRVRSVKRSCRSSRYSVGFGDVRTFVRDWFWSVSQAWCAVRPWPPNCRNERACRTTRMSIARSDATIGAAVLAGAWPPRDYKRIVAIFREGAAPPIRSNDKFPHLGALSPLRSVSECPR
jgi:hypothetical protein